MSELIEPEPEIPRALSDPMAAWETGDRQPVAIELGKLETASRRIWTST